MKEKIKAKLNKKRQTAAFALLLALALLAGCGSGAAYDPNSEEKAPDAQKSGLTAVSMQASLADIWLTAGGVLAGVTDDAIERGLCPEDTPVIGTTKSPSAEAVIALKPDVVLYSPDIAGQLQAAEVLEDCGIKTVAAKEDTFAEYLENLKTFAGLLGSETAYEEYGEKVSKEIEVIKEKAKEKLAERSEPLTALFIRAYSSGYKVKARGHIVCDMLSDLCVVNIADRNGAALEELSLEQIYADDPDFIFIVFMGDDEQASRANLEENLFSSPVWQSLSACKEGRMIFLERDLFHYKPNARWAEAYQRLFDILYEE